MIEFGTLAVKRIYAKTRDLFRRPEKKRGLRFVQREGCGLCTPKDMVLYVKTMRFTPGDIYLLNCIRQELSHELGPEQNVTDQEVLNIALQELQLALGSSRREDEVLRLRFQLWDAKIKGD